jgi:peptide chain release factor 2
MGGAGFWDNADKAQVLVEELRRLRAAIEPLKKLQKAADDLKVLMEFADDDESSLAELEAMLPQLSSDLEEVELKAIMNHPTDACNAYVMAQAGEGGTDSADWAEMLINMYIKWAERKGLKVELIERSDGEGAGIRNATIKISGDYIFGYLKGETGNHRLIRMSPFDSSGRRHTSFAAVDVTPEIDDAIDIDINWDEDVDDITMRASGAGGQKVNKTESAVQLKHIKTGVIVRCQNERSQHQNRALARKMLLAKLYAMELGKREAEISARRGEKSKIGFGGHTVRNYVLHPNQFAKDTRSKFKVGTPYETLNGDLDPFLDSFLRWTIGKLKIDDEGDDD